MKLCHLLSSEKHLHENRVSRFIPAVSSTAHTHLTYYAVLTFSSESKPITRISTAIVERHKHGNQPTSKRYLGRGCHYV